MENHNDCLPPLCQLPYNLHQFNLIGNIKKRSRFIHHNNRRILCQCHGNIYLLLHSSGVLILTYGYRAASEGGPDAGSGQRALLSYDGGASWSEPVILRDDGPDGDLGYPATCELDDGTLLTVYYQKQRTGESCSILYTRWKL